MERQSSARPPKMKAPDSRPDSPARARVLFSREGLLGLWPRWPLSLALLLVGALNILGGLSLPLTVARRIQALDGFAESMSAVGGTAAVLLGLMLVVAGIGLYRRLSFAWTLAVLLLVVAVGVDVARARWGLSLGLQAILLGALLLVRRHFTRRSALASFLFSLSSIFAILAYGVFGAYLLGGGFRPQIHDLGTALYFTIITLSTVGYGDIIPVTAEARWFAVSLLVVGLGVFASAIASALGPKISGELDRILNPKKRGMEHKNHVILVGEGSLARNTAEELKRRRVNFVHVVAPNAGISAEDGAVIEGDATSDTVLGQAGIQHARLVIAARDDDGENAFISLGAKDLNPKVRVLAVASSPAAIRRLKLARADLVFSPIAVGSRLLTNLVEGKQILPEFQDLLEGHPQHAAEPPHEETHRPSSSRPGAR